MNQWLTPRKRRTGSNLVDMGWVVWNWIRRKHRRTHWKELNRRYYDGRGWPTCEDIALFDPEKVRTTRYRYRGTVIPSPWPTAG